MPGTQTAAVVGQSGEEIYTDKYGIVKVQFHWDRDGANDENSSCWIRVSQDWTGNSWGGISIPRIGQEVVVDFLEGDPDRPVVLQRLYNGEQVPPYTLPAGPRVTGLESTSTKYNEFRVDDTKGEEQIRERDDRRLESGNEPVAPYDAAATFGNASGADNGASSDQPVLYFNYFLDTEAVDGGSTTLGFGANEPSQQQTAVDQKEFADVTIKAPIEK